MKRLAIAVGVVVAVLLVVALAIPFFVDANLYRPALEDRLSRSLGRAVKVADLKLSILSGSVKASDLSIADDPAFSRAPFVQADTLNVGVELMPLIFSRKLNVTVITLDKPVIALIENAQGVWNFSSLGGIVSTTPAPRAALTPVPSQGSAATSDLSVADLRISDGRVAITRLGEKAKPLVLDKLDGDIKHLSETASLPVVITASLPSGGQLKLDGNAGPINTGEVVATPFDAKVSVSGLDLAKSGVFDAAIGMAGIASLEGTAKSQRSDVTIQVKAKCTDLVLTKGGRPAKRPVDMDFDITHDLKKESGVVRRGEIRIGGAVAALTGTYNVQAEPARLSLKLNGSNMPVSDLAAMLPALDIVLPAGASVEGGTAQVSLASEGPTDSIVTTGNVTLDNTRLANYDLASKLKVIQELAGVKADPHTTIQKLSTTLKNSSAGTVLDNVQLRIPSIGDMTGAGSISPSHELNLKMRVVVHSAVASIGGFAGKNGIPFTISGTADNPSFRPDVKGIAVDELKDLTKGVGPAGGLIDSLFGGKKKK